MSNTLSLLALKCAPRMFDLSSGQAHVSIRDQIVRGRLLVRDLCAGDPSCKHILVVGAGVAGVSAALAAAELGREVLVVDPNKLPFSLQRSVSNRFVGPFMYEWPASFYDDQTYPPLDPAMWPKMPIGSTLRWTSKNPISAAQLAVQLDSSLQSALKTWPSGSLPPKFLLSVSPKVVKDYLKDVFLKFDSGMSISGSLWPVASTSQTIEFKPDYVVLAAGMGPERTELLGVKGPDFWAADTLRDAGTSAKKVAVFGGGDGALQDVLRSITRFDHPIEFLKYLKENVGVRKALDNVKGTLLSIEQQHRLLSTWTSDKEVFREVDERCQSVAAHLAGLPAVCSRVAKGLRLNTGSGEVNLVWRDSFFTKAYLLNRFIVHLIDQCARAATTKFRNQMKLVLWPSTEVESVLGAGAPYVFTLRRSNGSSSVLVADEVAIRLGVEQDKAPGVQLVGLSEKKRARRTRLAQIPVPFVVEAR